MNILVFSWRDPKHPLAGGAEQVVHEHLKGWIREGHKVTLFSSKTGNLPKCEIIDGVEIVRSGYQYLGVQIAGFFYYLKYGKNFDFIVDQFHGVPFFTPFYSRKPKLAIIQETAKKVWFLNPLPKPLNWMVGLIGYLGEPAIFLLYKNTPFMTGSKSTKKDVTAMGIPSGNITVVNHGVILPEFTIYPLREASNLQFTIKNKIKTVVFLGVLSKDKGIEDAIKCFKILSKIGKFQFWVIGKEETKEYGKKIKKLVRDLKLAKQIKFWGFVSQSKKFKLLSTAHILINPSVHEGWGLVNIEANCVGTPVVAYPSAGLIDSVKPGISGIICGESTPENLAQETFSLLQDSQRYEKLKKGALNWSKKINWKKSINQSLSLVNKIKND